MEFGPEDQVLLNNAKGRVSKKKVELSTKHLTLPQGPPVVEKKLWSTRYETNSAWYGSSLESFEGLTHPLDQDPSWEGSPHQKMILKQNPEF